MGRQERISRYERSAEEKPRGGWVSASSAERTERGEGVGIDAIPLERFNRIRLSSRPSSIVLFSALLKEGRFIDIRNFRWLKRKKKIYRHFRLLRSPCKTRFSSHASALVQSLRNWRIYIPFRGSIPETKIKILHEEKGLFVRVVENLIGWSEMERDRDIEQVKQVDYNNQTSGTGS